MDFRISADLKVFQGQHMLVQIIHEPTEQLPVEMGAGDNLK
jgi:hypothetical protein